MSHEIAKAGFDNESPMTERQCTQQLYPPAMDPHVRHHFHLQISEELSAFQFYGCLRAMSKQAQGHDALGGQKMRANLGQ